MAFVTSSARVANLRWFSILLRRRVFASFRPEVVNHHAAQASVKVASEDPVADLDANGSGTARIVDLAVEHGVGKFIYAGSGGTAYGEPTTLPVPESHPTLPVSNYGTSKLVGEMYVSLAMRKRGLNATVLRYANAYGPRQDPHGEAGVVAIFTGRMLDGEACTIDGDGEQRKDYIYVGDIARANVLALDRAANDTLNIGTGDGVSVNTIFSALNDSTGNTTPALYGPPRVGDVRNFWLDIARAKEALGWAPEVSFADGIARTVAWYRENR